MNVNNRKRNEWSHLHLIVKTFLLSIQIIIATGCLIWIYVTIADSNPLLCSLLMGLYDDWFHWMMIWLIHQAPPVAPAYMYPQNKLVNHLNIIYGVSTKTFTASDQSQGSNHLVHGSHLKSSAGAPPPPYTRIWSNYIYLKLLYFVIIGVIYKCNINSNNKMLLL